MASSPARERRTLYAHQQLNIPALRHLYTADYLQGEYARALEVARQNQDQEMFYSYLEIIPIHGQLGMKQGALEAWRMLLKQYPGATATTFADWWRLWNMRDEEVARLMDGVYKSGVVGTEPTPIN
jgi:uncharacterized phage-like protein YoqJ